ncbi:ShlB/FhaC/HecB family hemolysin secretion/activation protein [Anabaena sp. FACHB-1237]|uniref:ShlB/FhaC/HecB family hemolysin secretion/activation protein n=1 Tax=Anabaena sp. FACHB-1237 TaxID=2692769 RepID=UPI00168000F3|nr:ShlB/FhaC/HecB family hemolysin secretion/activation protein [Anabaena sp. FACHB-1237]MBD2137777.1 ShlB/FhaC/HecB family hemolysin secretion/activation protein [Anabaena sp. FACHB-1237]
MVTRHLQRFLFILPSLLFLFSTFNSAKAISNNSPNDDKNNNNSHLSNQIFIPYMEQIKTQLSPGLLFRLPSQFPDLKNSAATPGNYRVKVSASLVNPGMTVSIFNCNLDSQACLLGSFSVNSPKSLGTKEELTEHKNNGEQVNINHKIRGYLINGQKQKPPSEFSSIMWEQDGLISRVRIREQNNDEKSENILTIATSMATATPINQNSTNTATKPQITQPIKPIEPIQKDPEQEIDKIAYVPIRLIKINGNNALSQEQLNTVLQKYEGKYIKRDAWEKPQEIAKDINQFYQEKGFIAAATPGNNQNISDGMIQINVTESRIADIEVKGTTKLKSYIINRLQIAKGEPVNAIKIEEKLRLLSEDSLFEQVKGNLSYNLKSQDADQDKILEVTVTEKPVLTTNITVDNNSPESVGSEKITIGVNYRNLVVMGDKISANYTRTVTGGLNLFDLGYEVPINSRDGKLQFRTALNFTRITQSPFDELNIRGEKQIYGVFYRQPIVKSSQEELALSLGFSLDNGRTFVFDKPTGFGLGPDKDGLTRTSAIVLRQDYKNIDNQGKWYLGSEFKIGTGLFNPTTNKEPVPDGYFFSWNGQIQRLQKITNTNYLVFKANLQLTPDGLLPAHQFIIGGGDTVRGYRQNVRSGDNGFYFSIEDRISLNSQLQVVPFVDFGKVWNASQNPNELAKQTLLISSGLGFIWEPLPNLNLQVDYAFPFTTLDDKGDNIQDNGWYFLLNYKP